jgi:pentatricopeptide repeat domain-containing protein 1
VRRAPVRLSRLASVRWSSSATGGDNENEPPKDPRTCVAAAEQEKRALQLFQEMKKAGLKPNAITYAAMITVCASSGRHEKARQLFEEAKAQLFEEAKAAKVTLNAIIYNAATTACADDGQWKRVLQLLAEAKLKLGIVYNSTASARALKKQEQSVQRLEGAEADVKLNAATLPNASSASTATRQWQKGILQCLNRAAKFKMMDTRSVVYKGVIAACVRAQQWQRVVQLLEEAHAAGFRVDVATNTSLIAACASGGQYQTAVQLLQLLNERGIEPDAITYRAAIAACANCGEWQKAVQLFEEAKSVGKIDVYIQCCYSSLC